MVAGRLGRAANLPAGASDASGAFEQVAVLTCRQQFDRTGPVEVLQSQIVIDAHEALEDGGGAAEISEAHRPFAEHALFRSGSAMQDGEIAVPRIVPDTGEDFVDGAVFAFERL